MIWAQIAGVSALVEIGSEDLDFEPSLGSHFLHDLTSLGIPLPRVGQSRRGGHMGWTWPREHRAYREHLDGKVRHPYLRLPV